MSMEKPAKSESLWDRLALRRSIVGMLCMAILVGMGERMSERFLPVYLLALGSGMLWPGYLNALDNFIGALYSFPGGWLADRVGVKRSLLIFNLMSIGGYVFVIAIPRWQTVVIGSVFFMSWSSISLPATMGLVSTALPKAKHVMGVAMHSLVRRFPQALGPIIGGIFIDRWGPVNGVRLAFGAGIVMALVALIAQQFLIEDDRGKGVSAATEANPFVVMSWFSPELRNLLVSDILIRFCEQIPYAYVVIWCIESLAGVNTARVSATTFGLLTGIEMLTAVVCYIPVARMADRSGKKPFVFITFINFALFPLVLYFSHSFGMLVLAFIIRGLKEFGEPTRKALIMQLAPEGRKAASFGAYYLCRDTIVALSAFAGAWLWHLGPGANFLTAFGFGILGALWFALFGRDQSLEST